MRLELSPLATQGDACPVSGGPEGFHLWHARLLWNCRGTRLDLRVLAPEPITLPPPEETEAIPGAIARCVRACAGHGALLLLANPSEALGTERIALAEGIRLFAITSEADVQCWDALLALGQPCYGVRDRLAVEVLRPRPANLLSALSFGVFYAHDGLEPLSLEESPKHLAWTCAEPVQAEVLGKRGFTLAELDGPTGRYDDRGNEGVVRAVLRAGGRSCWTQPRFVAPRKDACHG
jgi:hypothetical protein